MFRDIIYELAAVGDLPLPQPSPPTSNKRERNADEPISSSIPSEASKATSPAGQPSDTRAMAGNSRLHKDSSISKPMDQQYPRSSQSPEQGSTVSQVPSPSQHGSGLQSRQQSQTQLNEEQASSMPSSVPLVAQYYTLPVYSNDLGRLPIHGQLSFAEQARAQLQPPQPPHKPTQFWTLPGADSVNVGEGSSMGTGVVPTQMSMGYTSQQAGPSTPAGHFSPGYNPMSEMSTMAPGPQRGYGGDAAALAAGMMFDTLAYTHNQQAQQREQHQHQQQQQQQQAHHQSIYGIGPMDPSGLMPGSATMQPPGSYRTRTGGGLEQQQQTMAGQQQPMPNIGYTGFVDNDTMAMWTNAPTGFECVMCLVYSFTHNILAHSLPFMHLG